MGALKFLSKEQTEKTGAFYEVEKKMTDLTDKLKEAAKWSPRFEQENLSRELLHI